MPRMRSLVFRKERYGTSSALGAGGIGWSDRIKDPRYKNTIVITVDIATSG